MAAETVVRAAVPGDAEPIVAAVRAGFAPGLAALFVYGCPGAARFVADHLAALPELAERRYTVAVVDGRVAGCTDLVLGADELFLSYVSLLPGARGRGVGAALLREAVRAAAGGRARMALDVLEDNALALGWYRRLGFAPAGGAEWWEVPLPGAGAAPRATVRGLPQADAVHARYGFSQCEVETPGGVTTVGRLGDGWYRLTRAAALEDAELLGALARLEPGRRLLAVLPVGALPARLHGPVRRLAATLRMTVPLPELLERLEARRPG